MRDTAVWLESARAGDAEALGQALERCRGDLRRVADADLGPDLAVKVSASDLVQETFLVAHRDFEGFHGIDETTFLAWLRAILRRRLADAAEFFRRRGKRRLDREASLDADSALARQIADTTTSPSGRVAQLESREAIRRELGRLPSHYRDVVLCRYWERMEFEAIGARLGVSAEGARKLCERALARLSRSLEARHDSR